MRFINKTTTISFLLIIPINPTSVEPDPPQATERRSVCEVRHGEPNPTFLISERVDEGTLGLSAENPPQWRTTLHQMIEIWNEYLDGGVKPSDPENRILHGFDGFDFEVERMFEPGDTSRVWMGRNSADGIERHRIFKYENNCGAIIQNTDCGGRCASFSNEQPLITEVMVSKIVCKMNRMICPVVLAISEPVPITARNRGHVLERFNFGIPSPFGRKKGPCIQPGASYRRIEEEVVGPGVVQIFKSNPDLTRVQRSILASQVLIKTISLLQDLHSFGFIHGDVHVDNIALSDPLILKRERSIPIRDHASHLSIPDLTLIDFGRAKFFPLEINTPECVGEEAYKGTNALLLSKYQLEGFRTSRRDDIYRAFEVFVFLVTDAKYHDILGVGGALAQTVKTNFALVDVFEASDDVYAKIPDREMVGARPYAGVSALREFMTEADYAKLITFWKDIYMYVADRIGVDQEPDYEVIRRKVDQGIGILNKYDTVDEDHSPRPALKQKDLVLEFDDPVGGGEGLAGSGSVRRLSAVHGHRVRSGDSDSSADEAVVSFGDEEFEDATGVIEGNRVLEESGSDSDPHVVPFEDGESGEPTGEQEREGSENSDSDSSDGYSDVAPFNEDELGDPETVQVRRDHRKSDSDSSDSDSSVWNFEDDDNRVHPSDISRYGSEESSQSF